MSENNTHPKNAHDLGSLLLAFAGRQLLIDEDHALSYLGRLITATNFDPKSFFQDQREQNARIEIIKPDMSRVIETANMKNGKDERTDSIPKGSIVKLYLNDFMSVDGGLCNIGVKQLSDNLLSYKDNPNVKGAILEVNSGGGEAIAGQMMNSAIKEFNKPVISLVHNAGSAAYMAILGSKEIIAAGGLSRVGSIGAYIPLDKKLIARYKDQIEEIYSDLSSDKNAPIREYISTGDTTSIKAALNETVTVFHDLVRSSRPELKKAEETLRGGMFIAADAKRRGLIDMIGNETLAIKRLNNYIK